MSDLLTLTRPDLIRTRAFIGGDWLDQSAGRTFTVRDPATGTAIAEVADGDAAMARLALDKAQAAFGAWRWTTGRRRAGLLRQWFDLIERNQEDLARLLSWEQGKPLAEARAEVAYGAGYIEWFAEEAKRAYGDIIPSPAEDRELTVVKEPVGVAAIITPWNFPVAMLTRKLAPALAAGCAVVTKPAAETPLCALALAVLAEEAGLPAGLINIVPTLRPDAVADVWLDDARVRKISFTGSTRVGKMLARRSADTLKRLSLELGGDAPFIVYDDADLAGALDGLMKAKFRNAGQACIAANRVYVQAGVYDAFEARLVQAVSQLTLGAAADGAFDLGPLISAQAVDRMQALIAEATASGARLLVGGRRGDGPGHFFQPTVLSGATADMRLCQEEIFGPILALSRFEDDDEALDRANATPFGLAAYVFSASSARLRRAAARLQVGMIGLNEGAISTEVAPFGGVKESGYGREGSKYGLADYQTVKYLCTGSLGPLADRV
jgi:succinate-semialdehyde dehydrogenase/glutarate-semialdehyde dehydrogenase